MSVDKVPIRRRMRAARADCRLGPLSVPEAFSARLEAAATVAAYVPVGGEIDPAPLVAAARALGCRIALPHVVDRATPMRFLDWPADTALEDGPFGLRQPPADASPVRPDIVLTPLVAFDRTGNRLGQGAGHYDRAFAEYPDAWRVGLAWSVQEVPSLVPDPWDVALHAVLTEKEWIQP